MQDLIIEPGKSGKSKPLKVGGKVGVFDWDRTPAYSKGIGNGQSPMYLFLQEDGEAYWRRLEKDRQGGRWEESGQVEEYEMIKKDPAKAYQMWGDSDIAKRLINAGKAGIAWEELPKILKDLNTWRQISGD